MSAQKCFTSGFYYYYLFFKSICFKSKRIQISSDGDMSCFCFNLNLNSDGEMCYVQADFVNGY